MKKLIGLVATAADKADSRINRYIYLISIHSFFGFLLLKAIVAFFYSLTSYLPYPSYVYL